MMMCNGKIELRSDSGTTEHHEFSVHPRNKL